MLWIESGAAATIRQLHEQAGRECKRLEIGLCYLYPERTTGAGYSSWKKHGTTSTEFLAVNRVDADNKTDLLKKLYDII